MRYDSEQVSKAMKFYNAQESATKADTRNLSPNNLNNRSHDRSSLLEKSLEKEFVIKIVDHKSLNQSMVAESVSRVSSIVEDDDANSRSVSRSQVLHPSEIKKHMSPYEIHSLRKSIPSVNNTKIYLPLHHPISKTRKRYEMNYSPNQDTFSTPIMKKD